jgi:hypothetical protein
MHYQISCAAGEKELLSEFEEFGRQWMGGVVLAQTRFAPVSCS